MRICLITTFFPPLHFGGDGVFVANLANALAGAGHDVHVIHCADSFWLTRGNVSPSPLPRHPAITVHTLHSGLGALSPILTQATGDPWLKRRGIQKVLDQGFDVIHWHNLSLVGGPGGLELGSGIKLCTLHDYWWTCPTHVLFKNNSEACVKRACFQCQLAYGRPPQLWRYTAKVAGATRRVDRFIAPSRFVQDVFRNAPEPLAATVLPHFFPGDEADTPEKHNDEGYYLFCGRLEKLKGLQSILPIFARAGRRLLIAGTGSFEQELRGLASDLPGVQFLGRVAYDRLADLYRGARATVVPSLCYETFGLVPLESIRNRTAVLASNFGALPEILEETGGGAIYQDADELEELLRRFDMEPALAWQLGNTGFGRLHKYSEQEHLRCYFQIIGDAQKYP